MDNLYANLLLQGMSNRSLIKLPSLQVQNKVVTCKPYMPDFPISNPVEIEIADGMHTMVYGPQSSKDHNSPDAPYAVDAGYKFWQQGYRTHLVSNSRIMNTEDLYRPEYDDDRRDYMEYVAKHAQRRMGQTLFARFENMCKGRDKEAVPDKYQELMDLVKEYEASYNTVH